MDKQRTNVVRRKLHKKVHSLQTYEKIS